MAEPGIFTIFTQTTVAGRRLAIFYEIQNVRNWDRFIRTLYEREDDLEIVLTGSNSELLSAELGSNLAGRFIEFFLELKRRGAEVFYGSSDSGREIDFLAKTGGRWTQYQVADTLTEENRRRELGAFALAAPYLEGEPVLLSLDNVDETVHYEGVEVRRHNLVRWLVG